MKLNLATLFASSKKLYLAAFFVLTSTLLVAYGPMTSYSQAQAVTDDAFQQLQQKALDELNNRINSYKKTMESLKVDVHVGKDGSTASITSDKGSAKASSNKDATELSLVDANGSTSMLKLDGTGLHGDITISQAAKDKAKQFMQKIIDGLNDMVQKVKDATSLDNLKKLAENIDKQLGLDQLTQVQGLVTQAVDSMAGVLDNLKTTYNNLQTQLTQLKGCLDGLQSGKTSVDVSSTSSGTTTTCGDFKISTEDAQKQAQAQLDSISTVVQTVSSTLASSVTLLTALITSFSSMLSGLGGSDILGNLGSLLSSSQLSSLTNLGSLTSGTGNLGGLMSSFTAILSQLNLANGMSSSSLGSLTSLANVIEL